MSEALKQAIIPEAKLSINLITIQQHMTKRWIRGRFYSDPRIRYILFVYISELEEKLCFCKQDDKEGLQYNIVYNIN